MAKVHDPASSQCCRFIGVVKVKSGKFRAETSLPTPQKSKHLGTYIDAEEAAKAVDAARIFLV